MEERKTAAVVLSILLLIGIILIYIHNKNKQTLSFNTCTVHVSYINKGLEGDTYRAAKNKLALCLCNVYIKKPDTAVGKEIMTIYRQYGSHISSDSLTYNHTNNIDSIIRNKSVAFDTLILVD
jgi:hypothetical protein